jgi:hypothetical protein
VKGKRENRYVIKVMAMRLNVKQQTGTGKREGETGPLVRGAKGQRPKVVSVSSLFIGA